MEMLEMAGLFKIRQWKLRDGREVEFAGIGGIAGVFRWDLVESGAA